MLFFLFILAQILLVILWVYAIYARPIHSLNQDIALFLTGVQSESNLKGNTLNKEMNFVIDFFVKSLEILKNFKDEIRSGRVLKGEVEIASELQRHILQKDTMIIPSLEIAMGAKAATEVWGDSYDLIQGKDHNYYIYLGDVTGHGVASGFVMMIVNSLIAGLSLYNDSSAEILASTNAILKPRIRKNMMMSAVMIRWNEKMRKLYYTGAGHEYILVYRKATDDIIKIKTGGVALGMVKDISKILTEKEIPFSVGDVIILYTDGISEARLRSEKNGMLFSVDRIIEAIEKVQIKTAENIFNSITIDLSAFMGYKHTQYDDISLIVARYQPEWGDTVQNAYEKIPEGAITEWNWDSARTGG